MDRRRGERTHVTEAAQQARVLRRRRSAEQRGMALTVISGIGMTVGIILTAAASPAGALCPSDLGRWGQAVSNGAQASCAAGSAVHTTGVLLLILGIAGILGGMGTLVGPSIRRL